MLTLLCVCNGMAGLLFAVQIGLDYKKQDDRLTLCLFFMFISFFAASAGNNGSRYFNGYPYLPRYMDMGNAMFVVIFIRLACLSEVFSYVSRRGDRDGTDF